MEEEEDYEELFLYLIRTNDLIEAKRLLDLNLVKDLNYKNPQGNTALHFALANNLLDATVFLLRELKVNYVVYNNCGNSPLIWGIQNKSLDSIKVLLTHDFQIHKTLENYQKYSPPLQNLQSKVKLDEESLAFYGIYDFPKDYQEVNEIDILKKNEFGKSVLSESFNCESLELLQFILEHPISHKLDKCSLDSQSHFIIHSFSFFNPNTNPNLNTLNPNNTLSPNNNKSSNSIDTPKSTNNITNEENDKEREKIRIREMNINERKNEEILNTEDVELDSTGLVLWESSLIGSYWLNDLICSTSFFSLYPSNLFNTFNFHNPNSSYFKGYNPNNSNNKDDNKNNNNKDSNYEENREKEEKNVEKGEKKQGLKVLELGCGCGLLGISFFKSCERFGVNLESLTFSDFPEKTLKNLKYNLKLNSLLGKSKVQVLKLNLFDISFSSPKKYDVIIGSDLVYDVKLVQSLVEVIDNFLTKEGVFLYVYKLARNGVDLLLPRLENSRFKVKVEPAPPKYQQNPFVDKSLEYCLSFFPELESDDFVLLTATRPDV